LDDDDNNRSEFKMKTLISAIALISLLVTPVLSQYRVGDPVDDFSLPNSQGVSMSMADYPDRIMFLVFWQSG